MPNIHIRCNTETPKFIKKTLIELNGKVNSNMKIVGHFNILSMMDRTLRQKIRKKTEDLNDTMYSNEPTRYV